MNRVERWVYDRVKDNLRVKEGIKQVYQRALSVLPGPRLDGRLREIVTRPGAFFGFHDKTPWSGDRRSLLGHRFSGRGDEVCSHGEPVEICVFQGLDWREEQRVAWTRAWNWQQGSQLQWLGKSRRIVFNDIRDGLCVAVIRDPVNGAEELLPRSIAAICPEGKRYAAVCFKTLGAAMPGYGYAFDALGAASSVPPLELVIGAIHERSDQRIGFADLKSDIPRCNQVDGIDFFSHCLFSPDGQSLLFLRRQALPNRRLRSEMFCINLYSGRIRRLPFKDMVSHFTWLGDEHVLAYANTPAEGDGYYRVHVESGRIDNVSRLLHDSDGHPHAVPSGRRMVFDTYPDRRRYQHLFLWQVDNGNARHIARLYAPMRFRGPCRVDLHPRLDAEGEYVCFDASFNGMRSLVTAKLP